MKDTYHTIAGPSEGLFKDRGSKFFAYAFRFIRKTPLVKNFRTSSNFTLKLVTIVMPTD